MGKVTIVVHHNTVPTSKMEKYLQSNSYAMEELHREMDTDEQEATILIVPADEEYPEL